MFLNMKLQWILDSINYKISIKDSKNKLKCLNVAEYAENQYQSQKSVGLRDTSEQREHKLPLHAQMQVQTLLCKEKKIYTKISRSCLVVR